LSLIGRRTLRGTASRIVFSSYNLPLKSTVFGRSGNKIIRNFKLARGQKSKDHAAKRLEKSPPRSVPTWPPEWIWASGLRNVFIYPKGEVGVLENVRRSIVSDKCLFITMIHHGSIYLGRLNFNDEEFCGQIFELLKANCGRSITEIGSIDIPDAPDFASG